MDIMYNLKPIDKFADSITNVSKTVYKSLKKNFGEALFIFVGGYVVYLFFVRGSVKDAMRRSILFIVVLVIGGLWVSNAGYYMKGLNALSVEIFYIFLFFLLTFVRQFIGQQLINTT